MRFDQCLARYMNIFKVHPHIHCTIVNNSSLWSDDNKKLEIKQLTLYTFLMHNKSVRSRVEKAWTNDFKNIWAYSNIVITYGLFWDVYLILN